MTIPYLSLGEGHRGNVGILQLVQGADYFLKDFSIELLVHNLHLKGHALNELAFTVPLQDCWSSAGNAGSDLILAAH